MKKCKYCGAPLDNDSQFCTNCGKKIESQGKTCPLCGAEIEDDAAFCSKCGKSLDAQTKPPVATPQIINPETPLQKEEIVYELEEEKDKKWWYIIGSTIIVALLIIGGYFLFKQNNNVVSTPNVENGAVALKGNINDNIGFTMKLRFKGEEIEGIEHYDSQRKDVNLEIKGSKSDNGTMVLFEYDGNTKAGIYEGTIDNSVYSGTFTNSKGKTFPFIANVISESTLLLEDTNDKHIEEDDDDEFAFDAWSGTIEIHGGIYRNCQTLCLLNLEKISKDSYSGAINLLLGSEDDMGRFDPENGTLEGKVRGKVSGNTITIVIDEFKTDDTSGIFEYSELKSGQQIFRLTYDNGHYSVKPVGKMEYFYDEVTDETKIYKK